MFSLIFTHSFIIFYRLHKILSAQSYYYSHVDAHDLYVACILAI